MVLDNEAKSSPLYMALTKAPSRARRDGKVRYSRRQQPRQARRTRGGASSAAGASLEEGLSSLREPLGEEAASIREGLGRRVDEARRKEMRVRLQDHGQIRRLGEIAATKLSVTYNSSEQ